MHLKLFCGVDPEAIAVSGSIGGLQLMACDMDGVQPRYSKVVSVGLDAAPSVLYQNLLHFLESRQSDNKCKRRGSSDKALSFDIKRSGKKCASGENISSSSPEVCVDIAMASVCYTHSPVFLRDLSQCLVNFKDYLSSIGASLRQVAADMAKGLTRPGGRLSSSTANISIGPEDINNDTTLASAIFLNSLEADINAYDNKVSVIPSSGVTIRLHALLRTPIIVIPSDPTSTSVLAGYPGEINIRNFNNSLLSVDDRRQSMEEKTIYVEMRNVSMFSVQVDRLKAELPLLPSSQCAGAELPDGYTEVLLDTAIHLELQRSDIAFIRPTNTFSFPIPPDDSIPQCEGLLVATGRFVSPLRLSLSKAVYSQILKTLDNLAPPAAEPVASSGSSALSTDNSRATTPAGQGTTPVSDSLNKQPSSLSLAVQAEIVLPEFTVTMMEDNQDDFARLILSNFTVKYEKSDTYTKTFQMQLQSLTMENLRVSPESSRRCLMKSYFDDPSLNPNHRYISKSCPDLVIDVPHPLMPSSLPSRFPQANAFGISAKHSGDNFSGKRIRKAENTGYVWFLLSVEPKFCYRLLDSESSGCVVDTCNWCVTESVLTLRPRLQQQSGRLSLWLTTILELMTLCSASMYCLSITSVRNLNRSTIR